MKVALRHESYGSGRWNSCQGVCEVADMWGRDYASPVNYKVRLKGDTEWNVGIHSEISNGKRMVALEAAK